MHRWHRAGRISLFFFLLFSANEHAYNAPYLTTSGTDGMELQNDPNAMECSPDGCPISVHFHIKVRSQEGPQASCAQLESNETGDLAR